MDDFLSKPLRIDLLAATLSRWLRRDIEVASPDGAPAVPVGTDGVSPERHAVAEPKGTGPPAERRPSLFQPGARVLVVDDDPINRRVLVGMLGRLGVAADQVGDGLGAVAATMKRRSKSSVPTNRRHNNGGDI